MSKFLNWLAKIPFPERAILLTLLLIIGSVLGFVLVADLVTDGQSRRFDEAILRAFRQKENPEKNIGPEWLADVAHDITALGGSMVISMITVATLGFLWLRRQPHAMLVVFAAVVGGTIISTLLKDVFDRPRPNVVPHLAHVSSLSFPSGHSMLSAATYLTLGALLARTTRHRPTKVYYLSLAVLLTFLIGVSRVFLGVHYPTDVLGGWCAGIAWALICAMVARWLQHLGKVETEPKQQESGAK